MFTAALGQPELPGFEQVLSHSRVGVIQPRQPRVPFPALELDPVRSLPRVVPVPVLRRAAVAIDILRREVIASGVVEHAVEDHADAQKVRGVDDASQRRDGPEPRVHVEVIRGVVPVPELVRRLHQRAEVQHRAPEPRDVLEPPVVDEPLEAIARREVRWRALAVAKPERLDRVHDGVGVPRGRAVAVAVRAVHRVREVPRRLSRGRRLPLPRLPLLRLRLVVLRALLIVLLMLLTLLLLLLLLRRGRSYDGRRLHERHPRVPHRERHERRRVARGRQTRASGSRRSPIACRRATCTRGFARRRPRW